MIKSKGLWAAIVLLGLSAVPRSSEAQTQCSTLSQTQVLSTLADTVGPGAITPQTLRNSICSTGSFLVTPAGGGTADTISDFTSYLAGTVPDPFTFTAAGLRTPGSVVAGSPSGGSLGAGTINATGLFVNGVPVSGGLAVPSAPLIGGNGSSLSGVTVGSGLALGSGTLSVSGAQNPASIAVGSPSGGNLGTGTINATGVFINGVAVAGGLSIPNSGLLGGNGSSIIAVTPSTGLTLSGGALSVTSPYNPTLVGITGGTINGTTIGASGASTGAFTSLVTTGAVTGAGFTNLFAAPVPIGSSTPNSANFTTLGTTGAASIQSIVVGSPTGGNQGTGTVNSTGLYVNGVAVAGGLTVPNSSILGGNGSTLSAVTVGTGLTFGSGTLSVTTPFNPGAVALTGGTINSTSIGASLPSTGAFTTLSSSGQSSLASLVVGSATGGNEGAGTVNATGLFVNGVAVAGGLSVPNASLVGGNGSSLIGITVGAGLSFGSSTVSVTNPYNPTNVNISGGTLNSVVIGNPVPALSGNFLSLTSGTTALGPTTLNGKLTTVSTGTIEGLNLGVFASFPSATTPGAIFMTSSGLFVNPAGSVIGPLGTVSGVATAAPILGGTINSSGTISCPSCATIPGGGALSAVLPIVQTGGAFSLGNLAGEAGTYWNATTPVTNDQVILSSSWPWATGTITSIDYSTNGTGSPSFVGTVSINATGVTGCSVTVNSPTVTQLHACTGANTITQGQLLSFQTSSVNGVPTGALFHVHFTHSNP